jgi:phosphatidylethanolamine/phosphatidyl-N-methylethanolamine N-methyltransferase
MASRQLEQRYERPHQLRYFLRAWWQNPAAMGAVVPSGRPLAKLMASNMGAGSRVVELGAGTGCVTQAIIDSGVHPQDLVVVEQNEEFCDLLRRRFPQSIVVRADARSLERSLGRYAAAADVVVSGLPLLLFSPAERARVLQGAFSLLKDDGVFHQFTYGCRCPIAMSLRRELNLSAKLIGVVPFNLPPAFVYRLRRQAA